MSTAGQSQGKEPEPDPTQRPLPRVPDPSESNSKAGFKQYLPFLRHRARKMIGPKLRRVVGSSDLIQDTLLVAIQRLSVLRGRPPAQVLSWLFQAMRFKLLHHLRDQDEGDTAAGAIEDLPTEAAMSGVSGLEMLIRGEIEELLSNAVQELPEIERLVILGIYREQRTTADLARELGRSEPAIRGIHFRGLKRLRKAMGESAP